MRSQPPLNSSQPPSYNPHLRRWGAVAVVSLAVLLYLNILPNTFIFDDWQQLFENPFLRYPGGLKRIFSTNVWGFQGQSTNYYRPLMHSTFYVAFRLFGYNPAGYHALSILLHALVSLLVYALLARLTGDWRIALTAGLLFAAHPIHTENVCWISSYPDLEAALFVLLAWWLYLRVRSPSRRGGTKVQSPWLVLAMAVSYFLGLLAKEIAIVLPVMALASEWAPVSGEPRRISLQEILRRRWLQYLALAVASVMYLVLRYHGLQGLMPYAQTRPVSFGAKSLTDLALFYRYWAKMLWPAELNVFPHLSVSRSPVEWPVMAGAAALAIFLLAGYRLWRARRPEVLGLALLLVALAPALTLPYGATSLMGERYLYLPSVGFCWLAAYLLVRAGERWGWKPAAGALAVMLTAYSARTLARNLDWRSEIPFYEKSARLSPRSAELYTNLGEAYLRRNLLDQALVATRRAAALRARYAEAHNNLGQIYSRLGQSEKAIEEYHRSAEYQLESHQPYGAARAYTNIGYEYRRTGKLPEAIQAYEQALAIDPEFAGARNNLGYALLLAEQWDEAERQLAWALRDDPALAMARSNLGLLYARRGELDRAAAELAQAARLEPRNGETYARLGDLALARGNAARAEELFRLALRLHPDNERAIAGLARVRKAGERR